MAKDYASEFLVRGNLVNFDWIAFKNIAKSQQHFEPAEARSIAGTVLAERLADRGLVEKGPCSPLYASHGFASGYRLMNPGWQVMERGQSPQMDGEH